MSLLDLMKDKPPVVSDSDVPWPPPNKNVDVLSSTTAVPFLTSSPLFPAKRTPSLREFLNPNYRYKREEKEKDSICEPSDLLLAIEKNKSSNNLSKTDFDLQRKLRHKSSNVNSNAEEQVLEKVAKDTEETQTISMRKNLDSTDSHFSDLISTEKREAAQNDIDKGVDTCNFDAVSEADVSVDYTTKQGISVADFDVTTAKAHENKLSCQRKNESSSSATVCTDKFVALKRKTSEIKTGTTDETSLKKVKIISMEEQENNFSTMSSDNHTTHENGEEEKKPDEAKIGQKMVLKADEGSTQNNAVKESLVKEEVEGLSAKIDCHTVHKNYDEEKKLDTAANKAHELLQKADGGCTQNNEVKDSMDQEHADNGHIEEGLSVNLSMSDSCTTNNNAHKRTLEIGNKAQELNSRADKESKENNKETSMDQKYEEKELLHLTTEVVHDEDKVEINEFSLQSKTISTVPLKDALQDRKQEAMELSSVTDACTSTLKTKGNDNSINTIQKKEVLEEKINKNDSLKDSSSNDNSETTGNETKLLKDSQREIFHIPKTVESKTALPQKIFITDSSESSSTETETSETDMKVATNQNHCSKEVLSSDKLLKLRNSAEMTSDAAIDSTDDEIGNVHQDIPVESKTLETNDAQTVKNTIIVDSTDSEGDSSTDEDDDEGQDSKLEVDEESIEVLVFNDSDDDDNELEDGEIDDKSTDESSESEKSMDTFEQVNDPSFRSKESNSHGENSGNLGNTKTFKGSKRNRRKRRNNLQKQSDTLKKRESFPAKMATTDDSDTRRTIPKPVINQSTEPMPESKNAKPLEDKKDQTQEEFSLLSTLTSTTVMDVTVAASEKELIIKKKSRGGKASAKRKKKLQRRMNEYISRRAQAERRRQEIMMEPLPMPVCTYYLSGSCRKGEHCQFRHEGTPTKKPNLCKYYVSDVCDRGDSCPYQHSAYPCKNFHLIKPFVCKYGDRCKFSHDAPTPETQAFFDQLFADSLAEKNSLTDDGDGVTQMEATSTNESELPSNSSEQYNVYSIRYSTIDEDDCEGSGSGIQEEGNQVKEESEDECEEKAEIGQQNESVPELTPSYLVPGMYTS